MITFSVYSSQQALSSSIRQNLTEKSDLVGAQIDAFFKQREVDIKVLSQADIFETGEDEEVTSALIQYLTEVVAENPAISDLDLFHLDGTIEASSGVQNEFGLSIQDLHPENINLFELALTSRQGVVYFSEVTEIDEGLGITLFTPITDETNTRVIKVLIMEVSLSLIEDIVVVFDNTVIGDKYVYLIDNNGNVLVSVDPKATILKPLRDLQAEPDLLQKFSDQGEVGSIIYIDADGDEVLAAYADMDEFGENKALDWSILAVAPLNEITAPVTNLRNILLLAASLVLFVVIIFAYAFSRSLSKPIGRLKDAAIQIAEGNMKVHIDVSGNDEVANVAQAIDTMRRKLKKSIEGMKKRADELDIQLKETDQAKKATLNILKVVEEEKQKVSLEKEKIDAILHSIGDGVFVIDANLKITMYNKISADISGYTSAQAIGKPYHKILKFVYEKDGKTNDQFIKQTIATGEPKDMSNHTFLIRKDGSKVAVADSAAPLKDKSGKVTGVVVVFRDVTKEREVDRMKTEFVSVASHQLRTPLSAIKWFLEMVLEGDAGKINKEQRDFLQQAFDSNTRMISLVNDLLNVSRLETGRIMIEPVPTDLVKLCQIIIKESAPLISAHNLKFKFTKPAKIDKINIDPKLISQVVANLLSNGIKYTLSKGKVELKIVVDRSNVIISVSDTGMGIPKNQQSKLFQKFFRADNAVSKETEGTGLGLYVAKSVVEASGGKIGFNSVENQGSTFWFTLPLSGSKKMKGEKGLEKTRI